ncbi:methyltransferase domain-containing protein [Aeromonas dhakensis]|uniref:methyltransferase domain-containing protein n=1 Tax=Aeromonas dhakensis TaxID=196024 RepID=UPI0039888FD7
MNMDNTFLPGGEPSKTHAERLKMGFYKKYLSGQHILDIGGGRGPAVVPNAIIIDIGFPGYDGLTLPFPTSSQDAVHSSHCLEHVDDQVLALKEWFRVVKIGGYLIITVPHQFLYERKMTLPSRWNREHLRFYTPAKLVADIESALDINTYRIRSLQDNDAGFDYSVSNAEHAKGCYEIEIIIEKLANEPLLSIGFQDLISQLRQVKNDQIAICGAGELGMEVINCLKSEGIKFDFVTDKNIKSISFGDTPIEVVSIERAINNGCKNFIIASYLYKDEIECEIRNQFMKDVNDLRIYTI